MDGTQEALLGTAEELYGLLPEEFTAAREERVRALRGEGARERAAAVKALRRPSVAAWLVNALVRHRPDEIERLLQLGEALREAQATLDADQLRELGRQRQAVVAAIGRQARALARDLGRPVSEGVADEVEETLRAALSDPAAAAAVRSGRLTASLQYAGFGDVDLTDAMALPPSANRSGRAGGRPADGKDARGGHEAGDGREARREARRGAPAGRGTTGERPRETSRETSREVELRAAREAERQAAREAERAVRAAADAVRQAEIARRAADQHRDGVSQRARTARERFDSASARVADLETVLASAREVAADAASVWSRLQSEVHTAIDRAEAAAVEERAARAALDRARSGLAEVRRQ